MGKQLQRYIGLYRENFGGLMLLSLVFSIISLILHELFPAKVLIFGERDYIGLAVGALLNLFTSLFLSVIFAVPLVYYLTITEDEEHPIRKAFIFFIEQGFGIFLFALVYALLCTTGFLFFIIPGIIIAVFLFAPPIVMCFLKVSVWKSFGEAWNITKGHFVKIFFMLTFIALFDWIITRAFLSMAELFSPYYITFLFLNLIISVFLTPFFCCVYKVNFEDWGFKKTFKKKKRIVI